MPNLLQYGNPGTSISPSTTSGHYTNIYDFANQYQQAQLDSSATSASFPYGNSSQASAALLASQASTNPNNMNYAYAALAQQAIATGTPTLAAAYQQ
jgi:hypothetical protein